MMNERHPNLRHPSGFLRLYFLGPKNGAGAVPSLSCGFFNLPKFLGALEMCGKMIDIFMFLFRVCASGSRSCRLFLAFPHSRFPHLGLAPSQNTVVSSIPGNYRYPGPKEGSCTGQS